MDSEATGQIRIALDKLSTNELIAIWLEHDLEQWNPQTLNSVGEILKRRLGYLPRKNLAACQSEPGNRSN